MRDSKKKTPPVQISSLAPGKLARLALFSLLAAALPGAFAEIPVIEYPIPTGGSSAWDITAGPDGNMWFTEYEGQKVGRITPAGIITEFPTPSTFSGPRMITVGPDGNLWFTELDRGKVARCTPAGVITEFPTPNGFPQGIATGPDGRLWIGDGTSIQRATPAEVVAQKFTGFNPPFPGFPFSICVGPDGNLWFTAGNAVSRITPTGTITPFPLPTDNAQPLFITAGPDGNVWFAEEKANAIGRITPAGIITEFPLLTPGAAPMGICAGPDGNLWFTEREANMIARITPEGVITEFPIPSAGTRPLSIAAGADGWLWFTEITGNRIGKIPAIRPDTRLGTKASATKGNNVYNLTGARQKLNAAMPAAGGKKTVYIRVENDEPIPDTFAVQATRGNAKFKVKYFQGKKNVTAQLVAGTFSSGLLQPGAATQFEARITAKTRKSKKSRTLSIRTTSLADPMTSDVVLIKAKSR